MIKFLKTGNPFAEEVLLQSRAPRRHIQNQECKVRRAIARYCVQCVGCRGWLCSAEARSIFSEFRFHSMLRHKFQADFRTIQISPANQACCLRRSENEYCYFSCLLMKTKIRKNLVSATVRASEREIALWLAFQTNTNFHFTPYARFA